MIANSSETTLREPAKGYLLSLPLLLVTGFLFVLPILWIFRISFYDVQPGGVLLPGFAVSSYTTIFSDSFFRSILVRSVLISALITFLTLVLSYPLALFLYRTQSKWRGVLIVITISPLLISTVVRTYGWMVILGVDGWIMAGLRVLGLENVRLANDYPGLIIGLTQILMPYMALCLIAGFGRLDATLEDAAASLGARPLRRFLRITLPLSLPGVALGLLLTFVMAISAFITPSLLGGGRVFLLATEIYIQALEILNWPTAAAMSMVLLGLFAITLWLYGLISKNGGH